MEGAPVSSDTNFRVMDTALRSTAEMPKSHLCAEADSSGLSITSGRLWQGIGWLCDHLVETISYIPPAYLQKKQEEVIRRTTFTP